MSTILQPGIGFPSYSITATWTSTTSAALYPPATLSSLQWLSSVTRAGATGLMSLTGVLSAPAPVQLVSLCNHNMGLRAGDTYRILGYSDNAKKTQVFDSGTLAAQLQPLNPDGTPMYRVVTPLLLSAPVTIQSIQVDITTPNVAAQIAAIDLAGWFIITGIGLGRQVGFNTEEQVVSYAGGEIEESYGLVSRQYDAEVPYVFLGAATDAVLDFQKTNDIAIPFVFVHDAADPTSWGRLAFVATSSEVPALTGAAYRADRFQFRLAEHFR